MPVSARPKLAAKRRTMRIGDLKPYPGNARIHDLEAIKASLAHHGQYRPIVVQASTLQILAGNGTWRAARELGWKQVRAELIDVDDDQPRRIVLVDNRANDLAGYDDALLAGLLGTLDGLEGTGFEDSDLAALLDGDGPIDGLTDPDDVPDPPKRAITKPGDVWLLGEHRLLCGDATAVASYDRLLGGGAADMVWTDPPYGVNYVGGTKQALTIRNDDAAGLDSLLRDSFVAVDGALSPGAAIYVAHPAGRLSLTFGVRFAQQGWRLHQTLVWVKDAFVLGHADYHYSHEPLLFGSKDGAEPVEPDPEGFADEGEHVPILYGYTQGGGRRGRGSDHWWGDNRQTSVLAVPRPKASRKHPTMKPVALVEIAVRNSSRRGHVVLDPFGGSGSTLMACARLGRQARLMELDPAYCDVIVERWENFTGQKAERHRG